MAETRPPVRDLFEHAPLSVPPRPPRFRAPENGPAPARDHLRPHPRVSSREAPAATVVARTHPTSTSPADTHCQPPVIRQ